MPKTGKRALVVFAEPGPLACKLVSLKDFRARIVMAADLRTHPAPVESAFPVDELAVVIEQQVVAGGLVAGDFRLQRRVAALALIRGIVRIAMVHALGPPAEEEEGVAAHAPAGFVHDAVHVRIPEQVFPVLVLENHALPALHFLHPLRGLPVVPPGVHPLPIDPGGHVPGA